MGFKLIKDYDTTRNARYIAEQRADAETIENGLNSLENEINSHKRAIKPTRRSKLTMAAFLYAHISMVYITGYAT